MNTQIWGSYKNVPLPFPAITAGSIPSEKQLLTRKDLVSMGINKANTTLLRWEYAGRFPRRLRLGGTTVVWRRDEIEHWLADTSAARCRAHYSDPF
jgi:prophage regulatory protein